MNAASPREKPSASNLLRCEELRSVAELQRLSAEWQSLWRRTGQSPFQSPMWLVPWARSFTGDNLRVLAVRVGGQLAAVAPFYVWGGDTPSKLLLLGNGLSDYLDITVDAAFRAQSLSAVRAWLCSSAEWRSCEFNQLPETSPLRFLGAGDTREESGTACPILPLSASPDYAPARQLEKLRYYRRRAGKAGTIEIRPAHVENFREAMTELFRLHSTRWEMRGKNGVLADTQVQAFHLEVAKEFSQSGYLRLYVIILEGQPLAVLYGFANSHATFYYLSGFDPAAEKLSPGTLLIGHAIEAAMAEGHSEFNFLRGAESYKYAWGAVDRPVFRKFVSFVSPK